MMNNRVGEIYVNNDGYEFTIIEYINNKNCSIRFNDGTVVKKRFYADLIKGVVKHPMSKLVYGVGYLGIGNFKSSVNNKPTKEYKSWSAMLKRCYSEKELLRRSTYKGVTVCKEWHNFQNFAQWFEDNYNPETMEGWHLDKDILVKGNKVYSPDTCCFVPIEINLLLNKNKTIRGDYLIGVSFDKSCNKFIAKFKKSKVKKQKFLGRFNILEEAFQAYKTAKEEYIKEVADEWKKLISEKVYQALINYQVEITD